MEISIIKNTGTANTNVLTGRKIEWIVIHYTAGVTSKTGSANNLAGWYKSGKADASSDYIVDDSQIVQYNPDIKNRFTWGVGEQNTQKCPQPRGSGITADVPTKTALT